MIHVVTEIFLIAIVFQDTYERLRLFNLCKVRYEFLIIVVLLSTLNGEIKSWHLYSCIARHVRNIVSMHDFTFAARLKSVQSYIPNKLSGPQGVKVCTPYEADKPLYYRGLLGANILNLSFK